MEQADPTPVALASLVDHMFDQVLSGPERAELLTWIHAWDVANPEVDTAHRVTGWIDVAYAYQARTDRRQESRRPVHVSRWDFGGWDLVSSTA